MATSSASTPGGHLLKSLIREPTNISPQKQREKVIETLGLREQPPVYGSWSSPSSFPYHFINHFHGEPVLHTRQIPYHYYYTNTASIPWHHLFNTSMNRIDPDDYFPQCDLYWMRKRYEQRQRSRNYQVYRGPY